MAKVLLVEDEPCVANALSGLLEVLGHDPVHVESAEEALARLEGGERFSLVLSDNNTKGEIMGVELLFRLRAREETRHQRFVLMSGFDQFKDAEGRARPLLSVCGEKGALFLQKPVGLSQLRLVGL